MTFPDPRRALLAAAVVGAAEAVRRGGLEGVEVRRVVPPPAPAAASRVMPPPALPPASAAPAASAVEAEVEAIRAAWEAASHEARRAFLLSLV